MFVYYLLDETERVLQNFKTSVRCVQRHIMGLDLCIRLHEYMLDKDFHLLGKFLGEELYTCHMSRLSYLTLATVDVQKFLKVHSNLIRKGKNKMQVAYLEKCYISTEKY